MGIAISRRTRLQLAGTGSALTVTVLANLALIPLFGVVGCSVATVAGSIVLVLAPRKFARRYVSWHLPWGTLVRAGCAAAAGAAVGAFARSLVTGDLAQIVVVAAAGGAVYAIVLILFREDVSTRPATATEVRSDVQASRLR